MQFSSLFIFSESKSSKQDKREYSRGKVSKCCMITMSMSLERNKDKISYFPAPYPDELMYYIIKRYMSRYGLVSFSSVSNDLFGKKTNLSIYFTSNFDYLCSQFPANLKFTPNYFIFNHTIMPFFLPFLTYKKKCKLLQDLTCNSSHIVHNTVGYISGGIKNTKSFNIVLNVLSMMIKSMENHIYIEYINFLVLIYAEFIEDTGEVAVAIAHM